MNPDFSSAHAVPGSGVFGTSVYQGVWVPQIKMVPHELSDNEQLVEV